MNRLVEGYGAGHGGPTMVDKKEPMGCRQRALDNVLHYQLVSR